MKRYRIEACMESPLVVRRERQSQRSEGAQYLAGTLLRGALSRLYLQRFGHADEGFRRVFLDEQGCRFGPLDPGQHVFALTAYSCKREPGFLEEEKHGVVDLLGGLVRLPLTGQPFPQEHCPKCGQDLKPHSGFWDVDSSGKPSESKRRWRRSMAAHVGIDRYTHTASESIFFTLPTLEPATLTEGASSEAPLHGWIDAEENAIQSLRELLEGEDHVIRIGHARTRGYGRVTVKIGEEMFRPSGNWEDWSATMLSRFGAESLDPGRFFLFSISLPTGAILVDPLLRYTLDPAGMIPWLPPLPSPNALARTLDRDGWACDGGRLWCVTAVAHHERLRGWNAAHGLPRQDEWLVSRGSVYAYLFEGDANSRVVLLEKLRTLESEGIGARRNEGFGCVVISDDFHLHFAPKEVR